MQSRAIYKWAALGAILLACWGTLTADEFYSGGITVDIDSEVLGFVWVEDATVNLYENAHIMDDLFIGDLFTTSGAVVNIYGGQIDGYIFVTTSQNSFPEAQVTVYGSDFAVDGVPVVAGTAELFLQDQELSGVYASGTPFAHMVDCAVTADFYLTIKLGWIESEADIDVPQIEYNFGQVDIGATQSGIVTVYNTGNANLILQSVGFLQAEPAEFELAPMQQLPVTIEPDTALDIEILYTPEVEGPAEAVLQIFSDDPDESVIEVALLGEGMQVILTPAEQIEMIVAYYQVALQDGTIEGVGRGRCGDLRARLFEKKLLAIQQLIDAGYQKHALMALKILEQQCDGDRWPCDVVEGDGVPLLNEMINELIDTLDESAKPKARHHWHNRWHNQWYNQWRYRFRK